MHFLFPYALFALPPIAGFIILLYLLKLRRRELIVPSTFLWQRATQDVQANAPFQKLRRSLLLLLQLLALLLLVLSLVAPFMLAARLGGKSVIIVLDASASMRSTEVKPSRFEVAKQRAASIIGGMGRRDEAALVVCAARAWVASPFSQEPRKLQEALAAVEVTDDPTDMRDALLLAFSLASKRPGATVYVISDGGFGPLPEVSSTADLRFLPIGKQAQNTAVLAFEAARPPNSAEHQIFLRVRNYSDRAKHATLSLYQEEEMVAAREFELKPQENHTETYRVRLRRPGLLRAEVDTGDDLAVDDTAYAFAELPSSTSVLLVTSGNLFLEQALLVLPEVSLYKTTSLSAKETQEAYRQYAVVIFDRVPPPVRPTTGGAMLIAVDPGTTLSNPSIDRWEERHPVLKYVNLSVVHMSAATQLRPREDSSTLAESAGRPLVLATEKPGLRTLSFGWNFLDSDLPLRVGFPVLLGNAIRWLAQSGGNAGTLRLRPGAIVTLAVPPEAKSAEVALPDGTKHTVTPISGMASFTASDHIGVYRMTAGDRKWRWAADLRNAEESDLKVADEIKLGARSVRGAAGPPRSERHLWPYLALLALVVLLVEWHVYHRRY